MKQITHSTHLPPAPEAVFAEMETTAFQEAKCAATRAQSYTVGVSPDGDETVLRTERVMSTDGMPDLVTKVTGKTITVIEIQRWGQPAADGTRKAKITVEVPGMPFTVAGQSHLVPNGGGTRQDIELNITCTIPLLGGKIEKAVEPIVSKAVNAEARVLTERLS